MTTSSIREEGKLTKPEAPQSIFMEDAVSFDLRAKIYAGTWSNDELQDVLDATDQICTSFREKIKFIVKQKLSEQAKASAHLAESAKASTDATT